MRGVIRRGARHPRFALTVIVIAAIVIRIPLLRQPGAPPDLRWFMNWAWTMQAQGLNAAYDVAGSNYPPLYLYVLDGLGHAAVALHLAGFGPTDAIEIPLPMALTVFLKLPGVAADALLGLVVYKAARRLSGHRAGVWAMAMVLFNPALLYATAWWGQIDSLQTLFMVVAIDAALAGTMVFSGAAYTLALLTKLQSIVVAPVLAVLAVRSGRRQVAAGLLGGIATAVIGLAPFILSSHLAAVFDVYKGADRTFPFATGSAFNLWALVQPAQLVPDTQAVAPGWWSYERLGLTLLAAWTILVVVWLACQRAPWAAWQASAALALGFFCLAPQMHERYLYPALAFLAVVLPCRRIFRLLFAALSATFLANLVASKPFFRPVTDSAWLYGRLHIAVSAANVAILLCCGLLLALDAGAVRLPNLMVWRPAGPQLD